MKKKVLALLLATLMSLALLAGCGGGGKTDGDGGKTDAPANSSGSSSASGGSVYWLNFKPESDEALQNVAKMYTEKTGVEVKVVTAASGTYGQTMNSEMDKSNPPTIFVMTNQADIDTWQDYCKDLTGTPIAGEQSSDSYQLFSSDGKLAAIGYCYECYGIIVNPDLVEKAGHKVEDIKNFDSLKTVVEDIHARSSELGFDAFTSSDMDGSSNWRFTGHLVNAAYFYESRDDGGWPECPATIKGTYMDNFKAIYDLCINNSTVAPTELANGGHDAQNEFNTGKAAFYVNGSWEYEAIKGSVPNATMIPYYCGVAGEEKAGLNCGTGSYWAINGKASAEDQQATMDFMMWCVTDPDASRILVDTFGVMPYKQSAESTNGFLAAADRYTADGCYNMEWVTNYQPNVDNYRAGVVSALNQYNADQSAANWELVRTAFVEGWGVQYAAVNG